MRKWLRSLQRPKRRGAYLITWGVVYGLLGFFNFLTGDNGLAWGLMFAISGVVSIVGGLWRTPLLDRLSFTFLTAAAALRGIWYLGDHSRIGWPLAIAAMLLWLGVAIAQVVVAGWPDPPTADEMIPSRKNSDDR